MALEEIEELLEDPEAAEEDILDMDMEDVSGEQG
jgi:hypothetical protein